MCDGRHTLQEAILATVLQDALWLTHRHLFNMISTMHRAYRIPNVVYNIHSTSQPACLFARVPMSTYHVSVDTVMSICIVTHTKSITHAASVLSQVEYLS